VFNYYYFCYFYYYYYVLFAQRRAKVETKSNIENHWNDQRFGVSLVAKKYSICYYNSEKFTCGHQPKME